MSATGYQLFPNLTADEFEALTADIRERGVMVPVELDDEGAILDGHHRAQIADSLGIDYPTVVRSGWTEDQKLVHVVALNAHRRHLTAVERADVVATLRRAKLSTRAIARAVGVSPEQVRRDLAAATNVTPDSVTGLDGKTYPARRPSFQDSVDAIADSPVMQAANERARWSALSARASSLLTEATAEYWVDRLDATQLARMAGRLTLLRAWIDRWEAAVRAADRPGLRVIGGPE